MLQPPEDLDHEELMALIEDQFGVAASLEFVPIGEDSWCYRLGELWVSVRRDLRGHVPHAYEAAAVLRRSGLDFVLAPLRGRDGRVTRRVSGFPVVVFPYVPASPIEDSPPPRSEVDAVVDMLTRVHHANVPATVPTETYALPFEADVDRALELSECDALDTGLFGEPLRRLLRAHRAYLSELRAEFHELARTCAAAKEPPVLTHGEPIPSNILRHGDDLLLADWGDAMWGPPERDWSHVIRTLGADPPCRPEFRRLYDVRWILSEVAEYAMALGTPHTGDADDHAMWRRLLRYLPESG